MSEHTSHTVTNQGFPPNDWIETTLGEVTEIKGGKRLPKGENLVSYKTDHPYIRITDLENNQIKKNQLQFVTDEVFQSISRYIVNTGDVIVSIVGSIGFVALIDEDLNNASLTENCVKFVNLKNLDSKFLYYFLISRDGQGEIVKNTVGAVQKKLPIYGVQNIEISLPPLPEQQIIASVLSVFDDKIELLREENNTLEQTAQAIFQEWFGKYDIDGELPESWRVGKLGEVIENFDSQRIPIASDKRSQGTYPYYGATGINDYVGDYIFDGIYTLLGEDGSVIKENGKPFTQYVWGKIRVNNHAHVLQGKNGFSTEMIKIILDNTEIAPYINGAVQLKINQTNMNNIPVIIPDQETLRKFDEAIQPIFGKIRDNSEQIQSLIRSRDELLPRLMRGEVRISGIV